jgi:transposase
VSAGARARRIGQGSCTWCMASTANYGQPVLAAIESMNGARFVHDQLELAGWDVRIADARRAKGIAPLACKTDRIDAWVLAELGRRDLIPEIWLPGPEVRGERERARFRLHLVHKRTSLKNRVHAIRFQHGLPAPVADLFGVGGRRFLERCELPEPWRSSVAASLSLAMCSRSRSTRSSASCAARVRSIVICSC